MNNHLKEDFDEFIKDKEEIREIIGKIGGSNNSQTKLMTTLFATIVLVILVMGVILGRISTNITLLIIIITAAFKIIWMLQQSSKSMHFQFWILNSLEIRINEIDKRQKKLEKLLQDKDENKNK